MRYNVTLDTSINQILAAICSTYAESEHEGLFTLSYFCLMIIFQMKSKVRGGRGGDDEYVEIRVARWLWNIVAMENEIL